MNSHDEELRLQCLQLANNQTADLINKGGGVVKIAAEYLAFVTGETAKTPRQQIDAVLDAANVR